MLLFSLNSTPLQLYSPLFDFSLYSIIFISSCHFTILILDSVTKIQISLKNNFSNRQVPPFPALPTPPRSMPLITGLTPSHHSLYLPPLYLSFSHFFSSFCTSLIFFRCIVIAFLFTLARRFFTYLLSLSLFLQSFSLSLLLLFQHPSFYLSFWIFHFT